MRSCLPAILNVTQVKENKLMERRSILEQLAYMANVPYISDLKTMISDRQLGRLLSQIPLKDLNLEEWLEVQRFFTESGY